MADDMKVNEQSKQQDLDPDRESDAKSNGGVVSMHGVVTAPDTTNLNAFMQQFIEAIAQHRHWTRPQLEPDC